MLSAFKFRVKWHRWLMMTMLVLFITGCAGNQPPEKEKLTNAKVLESSGNDSEIIDLYKRELKVKESNETRIKLVKRYLQIKDYDSAEFYLSPLMKHKEDNASNRSHILLLAGQIAIGLEQREKAYSLLEKVQRLTPDDSESANLLGILAAKKGELILAREWFNQARMNMADDRTVKNNLALVDVFERDYISALRRLQPLPELRQLSNQTRVTLSLIYAKTDQLSAFEVLTGDMAKDEQVVLFRQLRELPMADLSTFLELNRKGEAEGNSTHRDNSSNQLPLKGSMPIDAAFGKSNRLHMGEAGSSMLNNAIQQFPPVLPVKIESHGE